MAEATLLTRRNVVTAAAGGGAVAVAMAAPSISSGLEDFAATFAEAFDSPYGNLENGDHNSWAAQEGKTFTTPTGHALEVVGVTTFVPFGRRVPGVSRTRAFQVEFQLVGGGGLAVESIQTVIDPRNTAMNLYLTGSATIPGRVRAMFN